MEHMRFNILIRIGLITAFLMEEIKELNEGCHQMYSLFKIANKEGVWTDRVATQRHKKKILSFMRYKIPKINELIVSYNDDMAKINLELNLKEIEYSGINKELSTFFKTEETSSETIEKLIPYLISSFDLYISNKVKPLLDQISYNKDVLDLHIKSFGLEQVNLTYQKGLYEVIDLYFMGYKSTSLLVLGRIFEEILTKYLWKLCKDNKINLTSETILNMRFENKLGFLKANSFISEKDWLIISKLKFDRNIGGHFVDKKLKEEAEIESEATIKLALKLINKFDKKLENMS